jgi:SET domain-containing protein
MYEDFIVKKSQIPEAGKGLYTKRDIKKGERFLEYLGELITEKELERRADKDLYGYAFFISKKKCIDAYNTPQEIARYANDAKGLTRVESLKNNCCYDIWKNRAWILAEKNIKAGEEILVSYGTEYWKDIKYNIKLEKEKQESIRKEKIAIAKNKR